MITHTSCPRNYVTSAISDVSENYAAIIASARYNGGILLTFYLPIRGNSRYLDTLDRPDSRLVQREVVIRN